MVLLSWPCCTLSTTIITLHYTLPLMKVCPFVVQRTTRILSQSTLRHASTTLPLCNFNHDTPKHAPPWVFAVLYTSLLPLTANKLDWVLVPIPHQIKGQTNWQLESKRWVKLEKPMTKIGGNNLLKKPSQTYIRSKPSAEVLTSGPNSTSLLRSGSLKYFCLCEELSNLRFLRFLGALISTPFRLFIDISLNMPGLRGGAFIASSTYLREQYGIVATRGESAQGFV